MTVIYRQASGDPRKSSKVENKSTWQRERQILRYQQSDLSISPLIGQDGHDNWEI